MAGGCVLLRTLLRTRSGPAPGPDRPGSGPGPSQVSPILCRDVLRVLDVRRYTRDQGSPVYFPQAVPCGEDLYDVTLSDGDCRLQVTLDPGLNVLVERHQLRPGRSVYSSTFRSALSAALPACPGASAHDSFRLVSVELKEDVEDGGTGGDWDGLPWFGHSPPTGPLAPLRANRSVFLSLWNNVDPCGEAWTEAPPPEDEAPRQEDRAAGRPTVSVSQLRDDFLSGRRRLTRSAVNHRLIARIVNKSRLLYFGKTDRNCQCPYKALLEVCDPTGSVCVVLWNSVCVCWFCHLQPGDIISLRRYRVKSSYQAGSDDIELSVNSRNPDTQISVIPESSVSPVHLPAPPTYTFFNSQEVAACRHGEVCDVIGLLTFSGRSERIRSQGARGAGLLEYRWLRLVDGASDQPIMVKLFSTSQPEVHQQLLPMSVVVCCRLKLVHCPPSYFLTNTTFTQVYCTGHHSQMAYRKLRPVRRFLRWLRLQDEDQMLSRAVIGGFFVFPPPPVSMETLLRSSGGDPGLLRGAELQRVMERLCYRERRSLCIQAVVTMVTSSRRGQDVRSWLWTDRSPPLRRPDSCSPLLPSRPSSSPSSCRRLSVCSPSSARSLRTPRRRPWVSQQRDSSRTVLFEASMEFVHGAGEEPEEEEEQASCSGPAPLPSVPPIAMETLPMRYDHAHREQQAVVMAMGGGGAINGNFVPAVDDYYTLRLRALSDGVLLDTVFLPQSSSFSHSNTWTSILSHGAFSSDSPPPSSADLITMAPQLSNQRLVCVLEACRLGGASTELVLSRAFGLS